MIGGEVHELQQFIFLLFVSSAVLLEFLKKIHPLAELILQSLQTRRGIGKPQSEFRFELQRNECAVHRSLCLLMQIDRLRRLDVLRVHLKHFGNFLREVIAAQSFGAADVVYPFLRLLGDF